MKMLVLRRVYQQTRQDELATFAENVIQRTTGQADYQPLAEALQQLAVCAAAYKDALAAARDRGRMAIAAKNQAQAALLAALDTAADGLDFHAKGDSRYILNAGMPVRTPRRSLLLGDVPPPARFQARTTGRPGEAAVSFRLPEPGMVRSNAVEHSIDGGQTWQNGAYDNRTRFTVANLPARREVLLRARSVGTRGRMSAWTDPVTVFVP